LLSATWAESAFFSLVAALLGSCSRCQLLATLGTSIASMRLMTDENYTALLLWTICVLTFACGVVALTQHPEWFGA
jgi:hypothetical protein